MRIGLTALAFALLTAAPAFALDKAESKIVATVDAEVQRHESLLEKMVNVNSGTMNFPGVEQVGRMMRAELEPLGFTVRWVPMSAAGRAGHLIAEHSARSGKRMLLIGHLDTVFELSSPFQKFTRLPNREGWAEGPGGDDMKGGLVVIVAAMRAMQAAGVLKDASVTIVMTGDEEKVGNPQTVARADLIAAGKASDVALDFEGLARKDGKDMGSIARRVGFVVDSDGKCEVGAFVGHFLEGCWRGRGL